MDTPQATGTSLREDPQAQALLADATVTAGQVQGSRQRLEHFLKRYLPWFYRIERHYTAHSGTFRHYARHIRFLP